MTGFPHFGQKPADLSLRLFAACRDHRFKIVVGELELQRRIHLRGVRQWPFQGAFRILRGTQVLRGERIDLPQNIRTLLKEAHVAPGNPLGNLSQFEIEIKLLQ